MVRQIKSVCQHLSMYKSCASCAATGGLRASLLPRRKVKWLTRKPRETFASSHPSAACSTQCSYTVRVPSTSTPPLLSRGERYTHCYLKQLHLAQSREHLERSNSEPASYGNPTVSTQERDIARVYGHCFCLHLRPRSL